MPLGLTSSLSVELACLQSGTRSRSVGDEVDDAIRSEDLRVECHTCWRIGLRSAVHELDRVGEHAANGSRASVLLVLVGDTILDEQGSREQLAPAIATRGDRTGIENDGGEALGVGRELEDLQINRDLTRGANVPSHGLAHPPLDAPARTLDRPTQC